MNCCTVKVFIVALAVFVCVRTQWHAQFKHCSACQDAERVQVDFFVCFW